MKVVYKYDHELVSMITNYFKKESNEENDASHNLIHFEPFQMVKIQNFLQPWWIISIKKSWILDYFEPFWKILFHHGEQF